MNPQTPDNEVIDLSPPKEWLYKCDCPQCRDRRRGELASENQKLRELLERALKVQPLHLWDVYEVRNIQHEYNQLTK